MLAQRIYGLTLGYEDVNDHDQVRNDMLLAMLCGKTDMSGEERKRERDQGIPLAGSSTLNRLELGRPDEASGDRYKKIVGDEKEMDRLLVDVFLESHGRPPKEIWLDLDATDDQAHGNQELIGYHGYYDGYCYLPLYIFSGEHLLCARLRPSKIDGAAGSDVELERIVAQIRARWPQTRIVVRGDSGFCREWLMRWCEDNGVYYLFGLAKNPRLVRRHQQGDEKVKVSLPANRSAVSALCAVSLLHEGFMELLSTGDCQGLNVCPKGIIRALW